MLLPISTGSAIVLLLYAIANPCASVAVRRDVYAKDQASTDVCDGLNDLGASTPEQIKEGTKAILSHAASEVYKDIEAAKGSGAAAQRLKDSYDDLASTFGQVYSNFRTVKKALKDLSIVLNGKADPSVDDLISQFSKAIRLSKDYSQARALLGKILYIDSLLTDTSVVFINEKKEPTYDVSPACTSGSIAVVTPDASTISDGTLKLVEQSSGDVIRSIPLTNCGGSLAGDKVDFPLGSFDYHLAGSDDKGDKFDNNLDLKVDFIAPPYGLTASDTSVVELDQGKSAKLIFNLANTFDSDFTFTVNDIAEFTTKVTPTVSGTSVQVEVEVTASASATPGSTNTFTLTGNNKCTTVTATRDVHVKDQNAINVCRGLAGLGASTPEQIKEGTRNILSHAAPEVYKDIEAAKGSGGAAQKLKDSYDDLASTFGQVYSNFRTVKKALKDLSTVRNGKTDPSVDDLISQFSKAVRLDQDFSKARALLGKILYIDSLLTDTSVVYINENREPKLDAPQACTSGVLDVVTPDASTISDAKLNLVEKSSGNVARSVELVNCGGSLASDKFDFPLGSFDYHLTGTDSAGHTFDNDLGLKVDFNAPPYDLKADVASAVEIDPGTTAKMTFNLANTFDSDFTFTVNNIAEFTTNITPTVTGTSVRVDVEVTASASATPDSTNTFTLTGDNKCTTVTATKDVHVRDQETTRICSGLSDLGKGSTPDTKIVYVNDKKESSPDVPQACTSGALAVVTSKASLIDDAKLNLVEQSSGTVEHSIPLIDCGGSLVSDKLNFPIGSFDYHLTGTDDNGDGFDNDLKIVADFTAPPYGLTASDTSVVEIDLGKSATLDFKLANTFNSDFTFTVSDIAGFTTTVTPTVTGTSVAIEVVVTASPSATAGSTNTFTLTGKSSCTSVTATRDVHVKDFEDIKVCKGLSDLGKATTPEAIVKTTKETLQKVAPEIFKDIEAALGTGSDTEQLKIIYSSLASTFGKKYNKARFNKVKSALIEISLARNIKPEFPLHDLVKQFSKAIRITEDYSLARSILGQILYIDDLSLRSRKRRATSAVSSNCPPGGLATGTFNSPDQFFSCLDPADQLPKILNFLTNETCLEFVVDTTSSMGNEIAAARTILLDFVKSEEDFGDLGCYVLVPFNDPWYGPATVAFTDDAAKLQALYNAINGLKAYSTDPDIPEEALNGMLTGLRAKTTDLSSVPIPVLKGQGSQMIVITDAPSLHTELKGQVITLASSFGVCIHFFLNEHAVNNPVYQEIATATQGTMLNGYTYYNLASFIASYRTNPCGGTPFRMRRAVASLTSYASCQSVDVTELTFLLKLSIQATVGTTIVITDPEGKTNSVTAQSGNFAVFSKSKPSSGSWKACSNTGTAITISDSQSFSIDTAVVYVNEKRETTSEAPPACSRGSLAVVTSKANVISDATLKIIEQPSGTVVRSVPLTNCAGALSSDELDFPKGTFKYFLTGTDTKGYKFEHNTEIKVEFSASASKYDLKPSDTSVVQIDPGKTATLTFNLANTFSSAFTFTVNDIPGFTTKVTPTVTGTSVRVDVEVTASASATPDSTNTFTLTGSNACTTVTASRDVHVRDADTIRVCNGLPDLGTPGEMAVVYINEKGESSSDVPLACISGALAVVTSKASTISGAKLNLVEQSSGNLAESIELFNCDGALASDKLKFPIGSFDYHLTGTDDNGDEFDNDLKLVADFTAPPYGLTASDTSMVEVDQGKSATLDFNLANTFNSDFTFTVSDVAGFSTTVTPTVTGTSVTIEVVVTASPSAAPGSNNTFTLTGKNLCTSVTATRDVHVKDFEDIKVCNGLSDLGKATTPEAIVKTTKETLQKVAPKIFKDIEAALGTGSDTEQLKIIYSSLASTFGKRYNKARFNKVKSALIEISLARNIKPDFPLHDLVKQFSKAIRITEDYSLARSILGQILYLDNLSLRSRQRRGTSAVSSNCPPGGLATGTFNSADQFFSCLDPGDHLPKILGFLTKQACLAFVVDTTASMGNEIAAARTILLDFVKSEEDIGDLGCYVLVAFNDPKVTPPQVAYTDDSVTKLQDLYNAINALTATGGGDIPEEALQGMYDGLRAKTTYLSVGHPLSVMTKGSQMVVITDAPSKNLTLKANVTSLARSFGVCIHFFLNERAINNPVYQEIATATQGTMLNGYTYYKLASFIASYKTNPCGGTSIRMRRAVASLTSYTSCQSVDVTELTFLLKLSIQATVGTTIVITDPEGKTNSVTAQSGNFAVFSKAKPSSGTWKACSNTGAAITISDSQSFSIDTAVVYVSEKRETTSEAPPACSRGSLAVVSSKASIISDATLKIIEQPSGTVARSVPLTNCAGALSSDELEFPKGTFEYFLTGTDTKGYKFEHNMEIKVEFSASASKYDLKPSDTSVVPVDPGKTATLTFNLANTFSSAFTFTVNDIAGFTTKVTPTVTGTSVRVDVEVTASASATPDSTNTFTLTGSNACTTVTASRDVHVRDADTTRVCNGLPDLGAPREMAIIYINEKGESSSDVPLACSSGSLAVVTSKASTISGAKLNLVEQSSGNLVQSIQLFSCDGALASDKLKFPIGSFDYHLTGTDNNGDGFDNDLKIAADFTAPPYGLTASDTSMVEIDQGKSATLDFKLANTFNSDFIFSVNDIAGFTTTVTPTVTGTSVAIEVVVTASPSATAGSTNTFTLTGKSSCTSVTATRDVHVKDFEDIKVCKGLSDLGKATTPEAIVKTTKETLQKVAPEIFKDIEAALGTGSDTEQLKIIYSSLASTFGKKYNKARFNKVKSALIEISLARNIKPEFPLHDLVKQFSKAIRITEDYSLARSILGQILYIDDLSLRSRKRRATSAVSSNCPPGGLATGTFNSPDQFFSCLDPADQLPKILNFLTNETCLEFVVDTTSSMGNEIAAARTILLDFVKSEEDFGDLGCYVLVPFNDPWYGPATVAFTDDAAKLQALYNAINGLKAYSTDPDIPEEALNGMLTGLRAKTTDLSSVPIPVLKGQGSQMIVITDAPSLHTELKGQVITLASSFGVCIHFFLNEHAVNNPVYQEIATATQGTMLNGYTYYNLASFIASYRTNPCGGTPFRMRRAVASLTSYASCQSVDVTELTFLLKLSIQATVGTTIVITDPEGKTNSVTAQSGNFAVFSKSKPSSGTWKACSNTGAAITVSDSQSLSIDTAVVYVNEKRETTSEAPPACTRGSLAVVTSKASVISDAILKIVEQPSGTVARSVPLTNCAGALSSDELEFPKGTFKYFLTGTDTKGYKFEHNTEIKVEFSASASKYDLKPSDTSVVQIDPGKTATLTFNLANTFSSAFTFTVNEIAGFTTKVTPTVTGTSVQVDVEVTASASATPDSTNTFTLTGSNACTTVTASRDVHVRDADTIRVCNGLPDLGAPGEMAIVYINEKGVSSSDVPQACSSGALAVVTSKASTISGAKLNLVEQSSGNIAQSIELFSCDGALASDKLNFPVGSFDYHLTGTDDNGDGFDNDLKLVADFTAPPYGLTASDTSRVEVEQGKSAILNFKLANTFNSDFTFTVSDIAGFSTTVTPTVTGTSVTIEVKVTAGSSTIPGSGNTFTLTGKNLCTSVAASNNVYVKNFETIEVCKGLSDLGKASTPEAIVKTTKETLQKVAPEIFKNIEGAIGTGSDAEQLKNIYSSLASTFGKKYNKARFNKVKSALIEISLARNIKPEFPLHDLVKQFSKAIRITEDYSLARSILGQILYIDDLSLRSRKRRATSAVSSNCPPGGLATGTFNSPDQFFSCLDPADQLPKILNFLTNETCLEFVVDTTSSMGNEIAAARTILLDFVKSEEDFGDLGCYVLVPFNDPWYGPATVAFTDDAAKLQALYNAINGLKAYSTDPDIPEEALNGMLTGLRAKTTDLSSVPIPVLKGQGSQMIVITDAPSLHTELKGQVITLASSFGVCIHFFLNEHAVNNPVYQEIATATQGTMLNGYTYYNLASFIASYRTNPCGGTPFRMRRAVASLTSYASCQSVDVTELTFLLKLSIQATVGTTIVITDPEGKTNSVTAQSGNFAVFSKSKPSSGSWKACSNTGAAITISDFQSFSIDTAVVYVNEKRETTSEAPPACSRGSLAVVTSKASVISDVILKIVEQPSGTVARSVPLTNCAGALSSDELEFPKGTFKYFLTGTDTKGYKFEHNTEIKVEFSASASKYDLKPSDTSVVQIDPGKTATLTFNLANTFNSAFTFTVNTPAEFTTKITPTVTGTSVRVDVEVTASAYAPPDSTNTFTLTGSNACTTVTASRDVHVRDADTIRVCNGLPDLGTPGEMAIVYINEKGESSSDVPQACTSGAVAVVTSKANTISGAKLNLVEQSSGNIALSIPLVNCGESLASDKLAFPAGSFEYHLVGTGGDGNNIDNNLGVTADFTAPPYGLTASDTSVVELDQGKSAKLIFNLANTFNSDFTFTVNEIAGFTTKVTSTVTGTSVEVEVEVTASASATPESTNTFTLTGSNKCATVTASRNVHIKKAGATCSPPCQNGGTCTSFTRNSKTYARCLCNWSLYDGAACEIYVGK